MSSKTTGGGGKTPHKNDMYGNIEARSEADAGVEPPIPAATVVLLRDGDDGVEVLMLKKNSKITFGGMWVFPGGKIDAADYDGGDDVDVAARNAAARETMEEAGLTVESTQFVHFAHWTPPPSPGKRFATWFFAAAAPDITDIAIDGGEIKESAWIRPATAIERHGAGEIDLVPPTWVTLYHLSRYSPTSQVLAHFAGATARVYQTRVAKNTAGVRVAMWTGDAGYEPWDADADGERHRLIMGKDGFSFEHTVEAY